MNNTPVWADILLGCLGAGATTLIGWVAARRTNSGSINTSRAENLWDANIDLRNAFAAEVAALREQLKDALEKVDLLQQETQKARQETQEAREETQQARTETQAARNETEHLRVAALDASNEVYGLRQQLQLAQAELEDIHRERMSKGQADG